MDIYKKIKGVSIYEAKLQEKGKEVIKYLAYNKKKKALEEVFIKEADGLIDIDAFEGDVAKLGNLNKYSLNGVPMKTVLFKASDVVPGQYDEAVFILSFGEDDEIEAYVAWWVMEDGDGDDTPVQYPLTIVHKWNGRKFVEAGVHVHDDDESAYFDHEIGAALDDDLFAFYGAEPFDFDGSLLKDFHKEKVPGASWEDEDDGDERYDRMRDDGF